MQNTQDVGMEILRINRGVLVDKLMELVRSECIWLDYIDMSFLPQKVLGLYQIDSDGDPQIILDPIVKKSDALHRSVLAEELGHHFTIPTTSILVPYTSYSIQRNLSRDEAKALRWACDFLMPIHDFEAHIQRYQFSGEASQWVVQEIADHFRVSPWLVYRRIHFWEVTSKTTAMLR